jgi:hypothetical protein
MDIIEISKIAFMKIKLDSILSNIFGFKTNTTVLDAAIQKYTSSLMIVIAVLAVGLLLACSQLACWVE